MSIVAVGAEHAKRLVRALHPTAFVDVDEHPGDDFRNRAGVAFVRRRRRRGARERRRADRYVEGRLVRNGHRNIEPRRVGMTSAEKMAAKRKRDAEAAAAAGVVVCVVCGQPARPGKATCEDCNESAKERVRASRG